MINVSATYKWAVTTCNAPNVGYSQTYRNQQTVGGITYYDCASFVWYALLNGGFDVIKAYNETMWEYTGNAFTVTYMDRCLRYLGFTRYNAKTQKWAKGDIMTTDGHTEMVYDPVNHICMGAHSSGYPLDYQVSISNYSSKNYWIYGYHYDGQVVADDFIAKTVGGYDKNTNEAKNNAENIYNVLTQNGWTLNAICGLLANIGNESGYNPFKWENDAPKTPTSLDGYGLIQFKPCGKYIDDNKAKVIDKYAPYYVGHTGNANDGFAQIVFIDKYLDFQPTPIFNMTYSEYKSSTYTVTALANIMYLNGLHKITEPPGSLLETALFWEDYLQNIVPPSPEPTRKIKRKLPIVFYLNRQKKGLML